MVDDPCLISVSGDNIEQRSRLRETLEDVRAEAERRATEGKPEEVNRLIVEILNQRKETVLNSTAATELAIKTSLERRQALSQQLNDLMELEVEDFSGENVKRFDNPLPALAEILTTVNDKVRFEADKKVDSFLADLEDADIQDIFVDKNSANGILQELAELNKGQSGRPGITGNKAYQEIARVYQDYINAGRAVLGENGVPVANLYGRMLQVNLSKEGVGQVSRAQFIKDFKNRIDVDRVFKPKQGEKILPQQVEAFLSEAYDGILNGDIRDVPVTKYTTISQGRTARAKYAAHRRFHLKGPDDVEFMVRAYGQGSVKDAMIVALRKVHKDATLVDEMGVNPRNTLDFLKQRAKEFTDDPKIKARIEEPGDLDTALGRNVDAIMDVLDDTILQGNNTTARHLAVAGKNISTFAYLGRLLVASGPDLANVGRSQRRVGMEVGGRISALLSETMRGLKGVSPEEQRLAAGYLGDSTRVMIDDLNEAVAGNSVLAKVARNTRHAAHFTFKYSGGRLWQNAYKRMSTHQMLGFLAEQARVKRFDELEDGLIDLMQQAGLTANEWSFLGRNIDILKTDDLFSYRGDKTQLFTPEKIDILPSDVVRNQLLKKPNASAREVDVARRTLRRKMDSVVYKYVNSAVLTPDARTQTALTLGQQQGSFMGMLTRLTTGFMSWPYTFALRMYSRESALGYKRGTLGATQMMATMFVYGAMAVAFDDFSRNRSRDWASDDPEVQANNFLDIFARSGVGGLYASVLVDLIRYNELPFTTMFGPSGDLVGRVADDLTKSVSDAAQGDGEKALARIVRLSDTVTPDFPLIQPILDHYLYNGVNEIINSRFKPETERDSFKSIVNF